MPEKIPTKLIATFCARGGLIDVGTEKKKRKGPGRKKKVRKEWGKKNLKQKKGKEKKERHSPLFALSTETIHAVAGRALSTKSGAVDVPIFVVTSFRAVEISNVTTLSKINSLGIQEFTGECFIWTSKACTRKRTLCKFLKIVGALLPTKFCFDLCKINGTETGGAARTALAIKERDIIVLVVLAVRGFDATEIGARRRA